MILVTGALGYIGSHTVVELIQKEHNVILVDNLSNTRIEVLDQISEIVGFRPIFYPYDLRTEAQVKELFTLHPEIHSVIHFAASKAVGESVENPLLYYENNLNSLIYLLKYLNKDKTSKKHFIFSSSCTVYGQADKMPIDELSPIKSAESPYGNTKQIGEEIISDLAHAESNFQAIALRYFNPIGAHESVKIGELPLGIPQNLIPFITQTAAGIREELSVFGDDYPTPDGTCIRDYIHVVDLAEAHVVALERLLASKNTESVEYFNLGTGKGTSVLEVIQAFEKVTEQKLAYKITSRREGDVMQAYADVTKSKEVLEWKAKRSLSEALKSAWEWQKSLV